MLILLLLGILFPVSVLPASLLQCQPFYPALSETEKHRVKAGYSFIFIVELLLTLALVSSQQISSVSIFCRDFYVTSWLPYFLWAIYTIRPYFFRHLFLLFIRTLFTMALQVFSFTLINFVFSGLPVNEVWYLPLAVLLYTAVFWAILPPLNRFFSDLFLEYDITSTPSFWKYACLLPALLVVNNISFVLVDDNVGLYWRFFLPRVISALAGILICLSVRAGLHQAKKDLIYAQHNDALNTQLQTSHEYFLSLQQSQQQMKNFCQKRSHYFAELAELISQHRFEQAQQYIEKIGAKLENTKRKKYCKDPIINAALSSYLQRAQKGHIPCTIRIQLPELPVSFSTDLSMVLANLVENAIQASEKQPRDQQDITLLILHQGDVLNILVKNRFDSPVELDASGLPVTHRQGHGIGMKSLLAFQETYNATVLCSQENGWFSTYVQVKYQ